LLLGERDIRASSLRLAPLRKAPETFILICLLNESSHIEDVDAIQLPPGAGLVSGSLKDALQRILEFANGKITDHPVSKITPLLPKTGIR
jgi:hypothetical protein